MSQEGFRSRGTLCYLGAPLLVTTASNVSEYTLAYRPRVTLELMCLRRGWPLLLHMQSSCVGHTAETVPAWTFSGMLVGNFGRWVHNVIGTILRLVESPARLLVLK